MEKNNVICILIDSVIADYYGTRRCRVSPTPFLDKLRKESLVSNNMYAHGPYTDAATKSLYTGRNCLDDYAFYYRIENAPSNHYKVFHENGYETYGLYYPYYIIGQNVKQNIDHTYYMSGFIYSSEWNEIFKYYSELFKQKELDEIDWKLLIKRTKLMFESWHLYYEDAIFVPQSLGLIKPIFKEYDFKKAITVLEKEQLGFNNNPRNYIIGILTQGLQHPLALLDNYNIGVIIDKGALFDLYESNQALFKRFSRINRKANILSHKPSVKRLLYGLRQCIKKHNLEDMKFLANYWCLINDISLYKKKSTSKHWKDIPSASEQLDFTYNIIQERKSEKPFYVSLHFLDTHSSVSFFSYDNFEKVDAELKMLSDYVDSLGAGFNGSLSYILSIRYVDYCIESFCEKLKKQGLWDNTTLMIFADHGSSYSFSPLHGPRTNTFDDENYHVPFIIRSPGMKGIEVNGYYNSKDMFPTLFDILGIEKPGSFIGHSLLDKSYSPPKYVMTEYPGPGCPNVKDKKLWFSIRDNKYLIGYKISLHEPFEKGEISVYDLSNDPLGYYDVSNMIGKEKINYLLVHVEERFEQIKRETDEYIRNIEG